MFEITQEIQKQIRRVVIGKDEVVRKVLMAILSRGHVLLEDVPGVGKTTMALAFAKCWGWTQSVCSSHRIHCLRISSASPSTIARRRACSIKPAQL